jgi:hypothetical protein
MIGVISFFWPVLALASDENRLSFSFRNERSPRISGAMRFCLCDPSSPPPRPHENLFTDQYSFYSLTTHKKLKKPVLESRGVSNPCDVAYVDYSPAGTSISIHLVITRSDYRNTGMATLLLEEFYRQKVPQGSAVRWGRILNPISMALFEHMKGVRPDVIHMGTKFY